ncbi:MAG: hypothetical protein WC889_05505 [Myxococcota bacterium]
MATAVEASARLQGSEKAAPGALIDKQSLGSLCLFLPAVPLGLQIVGMVGLSRICGPQDGITYLPPPDKQLQDKLRGLLEQNNRQPHSKHGRDSFWDGIAAREEWTSSLKARLSETRSIESAASNDLELMSYSW